MMNNIFYNIASILIGLVFIPYIILNVKKNKIYQTVVYSILSVLFLFFGIYGFFLPKEYEYISILAMLAFSILGILFYLLTNKKDKNKTSK